MATANVYSDNSVAKQVAAPTSAVTSDKPAAIKSIVFFKQSILKVLRLTFHPEVNVHKPGIATIAKLLETHVHEIVKLPNLDATSHYRTSLIAVWTSCRKDHCLSQTAHPNETNVGC